MFTHPNPRRVAIIGGGECKFLFFYGCFFFSIVVVGCFVLCLFCFVFVLSTVVATKKKMGSYHKRDMVVPDAERFS